MREKLLTVSGDSMRSLLSPGDRVAYAPLSDPSAVSRGDIVVLMKWGGAGGGVLVHRVIGRRGSALITKGDASWRMDAGSESLMVVGRATAVRRAGRWYSLEGRARRWWPLPALLSPPVETLIMLLILAERILLAYAELLMLRMPAGYGTWSRVSNRWRALSDGPGKLGLFNLPARATAFLLEPAETPAADGERRSPETHIGRLSGEAAWEGDVRLRGDLVIEPGARLTLRAGCRVTVAPGRTRWPVSRPGGGEWVTLDASPKILVLGTLLAEGTGEAPVRISGEDWAGIHFIGSSEGDLRGVESRGASEGVTCWDSSLAVLRDCRIRGPKGLSAYGSSTLTAAGCEIGGGGTGLIAADSARVKAEGSRWEGAGTGILLKNGARARLKDCRARSERGSALVMQDGAELKGEDLFLEAPAGACADLRGGSGLRIDGGGLSGSEGALRIGASSARLARTRLSGGSGPGVTIADGGALRGAGVEIESSLQALDMDASTARLSDFSLSSRTGWAASLRARSRMTLRGGKAEGLAGAFRLERARADIKDARVEAGRGSGIAALYGSELRARGLTIRAGEQALDLSASRALLRETELSSEAYRSVVLRSGARLSLLGGVLRARDAAVDAEGSEVLLEAAEAASSAGHAASLRARSALKALDCSFSGPEGAIRLERSRAELRRSRLDSREGRGAAALDGSALRAEGCAFSSHREAFELDRSGAVAEGTEFVSEESIAVSLRERSRTTLRRCEASGAAGGIKLRDSGADLEDVRARAAEGPGIVMSEGSRLTGIRVTSRSAREALAVACSRAALSFFSLSSGRAGAVSLERGSRLKLESGRLSGKGGGLLSRGSRARLVGVRAASLGGAGIMVTEGGGLTGRSVESRAVLDALSLDGSHADLKGARLVSTRHVALSAAGGSRVQGKRIRADGRSASLRLSASSLDLEGGALRGAGYSILSRDSEMFLEGVRVEGDKGCLLSSSRCIAASVVLRGSKTALAAKKSELELRSARVSSGDGNGLEIGESSRLEIEESVVSAGVGALSSEGSAFEARDCRFSGAAFGLRLTGGESGLDSVEIKGGRKSGIDLRGGRHDFRELRLEDCPEPAVSIDDGAELELSDALYNGKEWAPEPPWEPPASGGLLYRGVLAWTLATRGFAPLRLIYRGIYSGALSRVRAMAAGFRQGEALMIYRGWVAGTWEPGISDLDFHMILKNSADAAGVRDFWDGYHRMKSLFPFLGELLPATEDETGAYLSGGGVRAREFHAHSRALTGAPRSETPPCAPFPAADASEALHAYTKLMSIRLPLVREHPEKAFRNARKAFLDVVRYGRGDTSPAWALARADFEERLMAEGGRAADVLAEADEAAASDAGRSVAVLCRGALSLLDDACSAVLSRPPSTEAEIRWIDAPRGPSEDAGVQKALEAAAVRLRERTGVSCGFLLEGGHRLHLIFASPPGAEAWEEIEDLRRRHSFLRVLTLVETPGVWDFLAQGSYAHYPTRFLESEGRGARSLGAAGLKGPWEFRSGVPQVRRRLAGGDILEAGVQSLLHLGICWRMILFGTPWESASHYLYSRAFGLRLLVEKRIGLPFSDLGLVLKTAAERLPDASERIRALDLSKPLDAKRLEGHASFIEEQLRRARSAASAS